MRMRVRGPEGMTQVSLPETATWGDLKTEISSKTFVLDFDIKYGYPPQPFDTSSLDDNVKLSDVGINLNGEQLIIMPRDVQSKLSSPMSGSAQTPLVAGTLPPQSSSSRTRHQAGDFPQSQAQSSGAGAVMVGTAAAPLSLTRKQNQVTEDPPEVHVPGLDGVLVLRVMPDDNSCMFRALGSAVLGDALDGMNEVCLFTPHSLISPPSTALPSYSISQNLTTKTAPLNRSTNHPIEP